MQSEAWLNKDHQFVDGAEIFRSDRRFQLWAYTVSHSQLLFRTATADDGSRIDLLFKPVEGLRVRDVYAGLMIRCATANERERILTDLGLSGGHLRVLMLQSADRLDYVVAAAVGWREEQASSGHPSSLAFFPPGSDPGRILPTGEQATAP